MNLLLLIYILGAVATLIFLIISFAVSNFREGTKLIPRDIWLSILSVIGWPIFWVLLIGFQLRI